MSFGDNGQFHRPPRSCMEYSSNHFELNIQENWKHPFCLAKHGSRPFLPLSLGIHSVAASRSFILSLWMTGFNPYSSLVPLRPHMTNMIECLLVRQRIFITQVLRDVETTGLLVSKRRKVAHIIMQCSHVRVERSLAVNCQKLSPLTHYWLEQVNLDESTIRASRMNSSDVLLGNKHKHPEARAMLHQTVSLLC